MYSVVCKNRKRKPKVLPQKALSNPHRAMWYFVIFLAHVSMQLLFSSMPDLIRRKHWCVCRGQKENPITRHTKAWATHLTGGSRCYLSTPPSTPISSSPAGVIRWQDSPNMSGIISHRIFCNSAPPPLLLLFFTVWRATLTINVSLCGRGSVSEKGSE